MADVVDAVKVPLSIGVVQVLTLTECELERAACALRIMGGQRRRKVLLSHRHVLLILQRWKFGDWQPRSLLVQRTRKGGGGGDRSNGW